MNDEPVGLTVQEAAGQLGIVERRLRRILARPEYAARTVTVTRQTKSGMRTATVLPSDLLTDISAYLHSENSENNADSNNVDTDTAQRRQFRQPMRQASGELSVSEKNNLLVQIVSKQDAEIEFLRRQVEELTATVRVLSEKSAASVSATNESTDALPVEDASGSPQEGLYGHEPAHTENLAPEPLTSAQRPHKAWWRFWEQR